MVGARKGSRPGRRGPRRGRARAAPGSRPAVTVVLGKRVTHAVYTNTQIVRLLSNPEALQAIPQLRRLMQRTRRKPCCGHKRLGMNSLSALQTAKHVIRRLPSQQKQQAFQLMGRP